MVRIHVGQPSITQTVPGICQSRIFMDQPPLMDSSPLPAPSAPATSLAARLMNVFAAPTEVFEEIRTTRSTTGNWLVPAVLTAVVMAVSMVIVASQPAIQQKVREQQDQAIEKQVTAGRLTRQQADQQQAMMEKLGSGALLKAGAGVVGVFFGIGRVFWWATVLWLLGRWLLRTRFSYVKAMEAAGIAGMIGVLGMIVTLLLQVNFSNPSASPSLALAVSDFDAKKPSHLLLAALDVFQIWQAGVLGCALARLANVPFLRGAFVMFGFWIIWQSLGIGLGAMVGKLFG
jgi:hypothetical protein